MRITSAGPSAHKTNSVAYRLNARTWAKKFSARLLEPGLVSYEDMGCGKALLKKETIDRCINTFIGRPVVIRHMKTSPENMKEVGHGYITNVVYNANDGWWYGEGVVDTDEARKAIERDGFGSVGYHVNRAGPGGDYHAIAYHEEIQDFSGEHLAIVDNPRYEGATIKLNSKPKQKTTMSMFKWFKKQSVASRANAGDTPVKPVVEDKAPVTPVAVTEVVNAAPTAEDIAPDTELELEGGEKVTLGALVEAHNAKKNGGEMDGDDEVMVNGKSVKLNELISAYTKANASDDDDKKKDKDKENAKPVAPAPSGHFYRVLAARENASEMIPASSPDSMQDRLNRGKAKYGSAK